MQGRNQLAGLCLSSAFFLLNLACLFFLQTAVTDKGLGVYAERAFLYVSVSGFTVFVEVQPVRKELA